VPHISVFQSYGKYLPVQSHDPPSCSALHQGPEPGLHGGLESMFDIWLGVAVCNHLPQRDADAANDNWQMTGSIKK
jgi:hypothetical protein